MDIQEEYEVHGQRRLFPSRGCRQILTPDRTGPMHRLIPSARRAGQQSPASFAQPYALKAHRTHQYHFDLRLCYHWIAFSWAMYSMPSHCPGEQCVAIQVEDHLREYLLFEGVHVEGRRGAGPTIVVDQGTWQPLPEFLDIEESLRAGALRFIFQEGHLLRGAWSLIRRKDCYRQENPRWILTKEEDRYAVSKGEQQPPDWEKLRSCLTSLTIEEKESDWHLGIRRFRTGQSLFPL
jgi:DNA ligase D-like protein (predicted 3'-phosphoesterase)